MGAGGETKSAGGLPIPRGPYDVGCIETEVSCTASVKGKFACVIYYPGRCSTSEVKNDGPMWLSKAHASALGAVHLGGLVGDGLAGFVMGSLSGAATNGTRVRAIPNLTPLESERPWPAAAFSHCLTGWRHVNSSFCTEIASHGCVCVVPEHTDGSACLAMCGDEILAEYVSWEKKKRPELEASGLTSDEVMSAGRDWRRGQLDQRIAEVHAALDCANSMLSQTLDTPPTFARTETQVALLGQSFGGATVIGAALRSQRFSRLCIYDPWLEGEGDDLFPVRPDDFKSKVSHIDKAALWRNGRSSLWEIAKENTERFADILEGGPTAMTPVLTFHDAPTCDHFAQTDANYIFEKVGALAFVYRAIKGGTSGTEKNKDANEDPELPLIDAMDKTVDLLKDWFSLRNSESTLSF